MRRSLVRANIPRRVEKKTVLHTPAGYEETAAAGDSVMKNLREGMDGDG